MPSDPSPGISDFVFLTERNIARISAISGKFAAPCLNEWRYATKHAALLLERPDDAEHREKAIGHLRRAYFDSSDILLTVLLDAMREVFENVGAYADVAERIISGYSGWAAVFSEAVALQGDPGEDRFAKARELDAMSERLAVLVDRSNTRASQRMVYPFGIGVCPHMNQRMVYPFGIGVCPHMNLSPHESSVWRIPLELGSVPTCGIGVCPHMNPSVRIAREIPFHYDATRTSRPQVYESRGSACGRDVPVASDEEENHLIAQRHRVMWGQTPNSGDRVMWGQTPNSGDRPRVMWGQTPDDSRTGWTRMDNDAQ